ncbi:protein LURP-one-related 6 [Euphorbia lathyris]|uniref:protein LURP-one-related 6 n=1 Tax=Euphorbia lathyris TaxID=212925 RepID=UPI0033135399
MTIISKLYCENREVVLVIRERPNVVNGGGFVVTDCAQNVVFRVDGCGVVGKNGQLILRDTNSHPLLLICRKRGMVQAVSLDKKWKGYSKMEYEKKEKEVFSIKESQSCFLRNHSITICLHPRISNKDWDFEITGFFPDRDCSIVDFLGNIIAQIGMKKEAKEVMRSKDLYHVVVKAGIDQAFVVGVISVLDYIYCQSTRC